MERGESAGDCDEGISLFLEVLGVSGGGIKDVGHFSGIAFFFGWYGLIRASFFNSNFSCLVDLRVALRVSIVRVGGFSGDIFLLFLPTGEAT